MNKSSIVCITRLESTNKVVAQAMEETDTGEVSSSFIHTTGMLLEALIIKSGMLQIEVTL